MVVITEISAERICGALSSSCKHYLMIVADTGVSAGSCLRSDDIKTRIPEDPGLFATDLLCFYDNDTVCTFRAIQGRG